MVSPQSMLGWAAHAILKHNDGVVFVGGFGQACPHLRWWNSFRGTSAVYMTFAVKTWVNEPFDDDNGLNESFDDDNGFNEPYI